MSINDSHGIIVDFQMESSNDITCRLYRNTLVTNDGEMGIHRQHVTTLFSPPHRITIFIACIDDRIHHLLPYFMSGGLLQTDYICILIVDILQNIIDLTLRSCPPGKEIDIVGHHLDCVSRSFTRNIQGYEFTDG